MRVPSASDIVIAASIFPRSGQRPSVETEGRKTFHNHSAPASRRKLAAYIPVVVCLAAGSLTASAQSVVPDATRKLDPQTLREDFAQLPLSFEANQGQSAGPVRFFSHGDGYSLFFTSKEAVLELSKASPRRRDGKQTPNQAIDRRKTDVIRMQLAGPSAGVQLTGEEQLSGTANYFIGNDPARWRSNVPMYAKVRYADVYPGVDLIYYGNQRQLEYDFVLAPGADPRQVKLHFAGAEKLKVDTNGDLTVAAKNGKIVFHKPVVYQTAINHAGDSSVQKQQVDGQFRLLAGNTVGFTLGSYDKDRPVVIDPTLTYSTYLGGSGGDIPSDIAVDASGNACLIGYTQSSDFPVTAGAFQAVNSAGDQGTAFVTKLASSGAALVYSTYLGGSGYTSTGSGIAIDAAGNAYLTGYTYTTDFPVTEGVFQDKNKEPHHMPTGFVTKLNPSGTALIYSTYLGGSNGAEGDFAMSIAIDAAGDAFVAGATSATNFPVTKGAYLTTGSGGFVTKLNPTATALIYSTLMPAPGGGTGASSFAVDASGSAYLAGGTYSKDYPITPGAFQTVNNGSENGFVSKLNPSGSALVYSTYLGGSKDDYIGSIAIDASGYAYLTGAAVSTDFPVTKGAFQTEKSAPGESDNVFVTKLNPAGSALIYSTYLGGSAGEYGNGIVVDGSGYAYLTGVTISSDFPVTSDARQSTNNSPGNGNAFMTKMNQYGNALVYSTYLGGTGVFNNESVQADSGRAIALDANGSPYLTGQACSTNFPVTKAAFQTTSQGCTNFVARFVNAAAWTNATLTSDLNPAPVGETITFTAYVVPAQGSGIPTGTVAFSIDGKPPVAVVPLDSSGHAEYSTSSLQAYKHWVLATYSGDTNYAASYTGLAQTIK